MTESPIPSVSNSETQTQGPSQTEAQTQMQDDKNEKSDEAVFLQIQEINSQVAQFHDLLLNIGQPYDSPEVREKIRRLRRNCVDACKNTSQIILPQARKTTDIGIPVDCKNLLQLFCVVQFFLCELCKSKNLIRIVPMDMTDYYKSHKTSDFSNVLSQILLCKSITPDYLEEELCSIKKDSEEIRDLIDELQEFMPKSDGDVEKYAELQNLGSKSNRINGKRMHRWNQGKERPGGSAKQSSYFRRALNLFCCAARAKYV